MKAYCLIIGLKSIFGAFFFFNCDLKIGKVFVVIIPIFVGNIVEI